ncbi:RidA family protein [Ostreibacterium oceani]|uniref:RidA family protein n=1 Tax=Ostreibacterium oceani TaxID=2654998 RepID=A0A6N7F386_9GAMM|nr:RidA family protein [Ostreibacterium oceani]MPV86336.1 RidA family protein [Ostreibacterium oceani]
MKQIIETTNAPAAVGTYSQAVRTGNLVFLSGQIPLDPETMTLKEGFEAQTHQVFQNLKAVVEAAGGTMDQVIKVNIFVMDLGNFAILNDIMAQYFTAPYPARAAVQVAGIPKGAEVEMEAILDLGS